MDAGGVRSTGSSKNRLWPSAALLARTTEARYDTSDPEMLRSTNSMSTGRLSNRDPESFRGRGRVPKKNVRPTARDAQRTRALRSGRPGGPRSAQRSGSSARALLHSRSTDRLMWIRMAASLGVRVAMPEGFEDRLVLGEGLGKAARDPDLVRGDHHIDGLHRRRQVGVLRQFHQAPMEVAVALEIPPHLRRGRLLAESVETPS